ncbi:MAG: hypothetical protein JWP27_723 [Flaviaesturariibacter sp.]|nr:hypothetical protein [Flaviaesturariibacter sp.]
MFRKIASASLRLALATAVLVAVFTQLAAVRLYRTGVELWQRLGISKERGTGHIRESFLRGSFYYYGASGAKKIATGDRAGVAADLLAYTKAFVSSPEFAALYAKEREAAKPAGYVPHPAKTKEDIRKERIAEMEKAIRETEANMAKMTPEVIKAMAPLLATFKSNLADYKKPESAMIEMFYQSELMGEEARQREAEQRLEKWEADYPADVRTLLKTRLQAFIEKAASVDFSAALKESGGKLRFVDPRYEAQSAEWKMIFRAGPEVIRPAVAFAKAWLAELGK